MPVPTDHLDSMLAIWNSTDPTEQEHFANEAMEHNVHFADPNHNIVGRGAFLAMVAQVQGRIPGAVYSRTSRIDMQNNFCRYHWAIDLNGQRIMEGFDMTEINDAGRVVKVIGFFGALTPES